MFNWLQHLFTARALQRENAELVKQVSSLQAKVDEQAEVIAVKDKEIGSLKNEPKESQEPLDATREKILTLLAKNSGSTNKQLADALKINIDFVHYPAPYSSSETWSIAQEGRAYLVSHGLL